MDVCNGASALQEGRILSNEQVLEALKGAGDGANKQLAEIYALYETLKEANLFHCRAQEIEIPLTYPLNVKVDSRPAMSFQKGTCVESKLRGTYDLRDKRIKELRDQGRVETDYVATKDNKADMFTKCMSTKRSDYLLRLIDNRNWVQMQPGADWITERLMMEDGNGS